MWAKRTQPLRVAECLQSSTVRTVLCTRVEVLDSPLPARSCPPPSAFALQL